MVRFPLVSDKVHPTDDFANGEESNDLSSSYSSESNLLLVGVTDACHNALSRRKVEVLDRSGIASSIDKRLEVGLEGGQVSNAETCC